MVDPGRELAEDTFITAMARWTLAAKLVLHAFGGRRGPVQSWELLRNAHMTTIRFLSAIEAAEQLGYVTRCRHDDEEAFELTPTGAAITPE